MDRTVFLLEGSLALFAFGILAGMCLWRNDAAGTAISFGCATLGAMLGGAAAVLKLLAGPAPSTVVELCPSFIPYIRFTASLDALGAFFCFILSLVGVALSLYSFGYARSFFGRKPVGLLGALFNLLLLATQLVFLADNAFFFLMAWEIMALAAYCLVSFEHEQVQTRRAGVLYFIMSHAGTGCLFLAFLLLFKASGGYEFSGFRQLGERLGGAERNAAFLLFLAGFGVKAGIVPLHIWLPAAHPVAPSNISALMSGVLIKTGIYGLVRTGFDFFQGPPLWWGVTVLGIGTVSALVGVLYALMQHDLKTLLAYHSIENIGIILMGLGSALVFRHLGHPLLAALALLAGLYHTINHAVFKALLFLGAGAVLHGAGTRDMEHMGGLIRRMPWTAAFFLVAAAAISALPPLNGFVSEWLTYQALLQGFGTTSSLVRLAFPISGAMLALTSALAAACFVKAFGIAFLAQPRSERASGAHEAPGSMLIGQGVLAAACVLLGLAPVWIVRFLDPVTWQLSAQRLGERLSLADGWVLGNLEAGAGTVSTPGILATGFCLLSVPFIIGALCARGARVRIGPTWDCGLRSLTPQMEYSATGFSKPIRMIFKAFFRPRREVQRDYDYSPYFAKTIRFESAVEEVFVRRVYRPAQALGLRVARWARALQAGSIQAYVMYIFLALIALLLAAL